MTVLLFSSFAYAQTTNLEKIKLTKVDTDRDGIANVLILRGQDTKISLKIEGGLISRIEFQIRKNDLFAQAHFKKVRNTFLLTYRFASKEHIFYNKDRCNSQSIESKNIFYKKETCQDSQIRRDKTGSNMAKIKTELITPKFDPSCMRSGQLQGDISHSLKKIAEYQNYSGYSDCIDIVNISAGSDWGNLIEDIGNIEYRCSQSRVPSGSFKIENGRKIASISEMCTNHAQLTDVLLEEILHSYDVMDPAAVCVVKTCPSQEDLKKCLASDPNYIKETNQSIEVSSAVSIVNSNGSELIDPQVNRAYAERKEGVEVAKLVPTNTIDPLPPELQRVIAGREESTVSVASSPWISGAFNAVKAFIRPSPAQASLNSSTGSSPSLEKTNPRMNRAPAAFVQNGNETKENFSPQRGPTSVSQNDKLESDLKKSKDTSKDSKTPKRMGISVDSNASSADAVEMNLKNGGSTLAQRANFGENPSVTSEVARMNSPRLSNEFFPTDWGRDRVVRYFTNPDNYEAILKSWADPDEGRLLRRELEKRSIEIQNTKNLSDSKKNSVKAKVILGRGSKSFMVLKTGK